MRSLWECNLCDLSGAKAGSAPVGPPMVGTRRNLRRGHQTRAREVEEPVRVARSMKDERDG